MVTLIDAGGVGKTRLAVRVAQEIRHVFPDGVWLLSLVDLPAAAGAALVEQTVAAACGLIGISTQRPRDALLDHLRHRDCLLVLGNCERLVDQAGALVADLLCAAPGLWVLATSREVIGCLGEHVMHVVPLAVLPANPMAAATDASVPEPEAEALVLLRQRAAQPGLRCATTIWWWPPGSAVG